MKNENKVSKTIQTFFMLEWKIYKILFSKKKEVDV